METIKWYRVIDPLSPLYGCDVTGYDAADGAYEIPKETYLNLTGMRRVDIFVGDRPFQLMAPKNENLGLMVLFQQLEKSPLQDEIVELATDLPYGEFLEEVELSRKDDCTLHLVAYENLYQIALLVPSGRPGTPLLGGKSARVVSISRVIDCTPETIQAVREVFERGDSAADMKRMIENMGRDES